jgi:hypothetical protein
MLLPMMLPKDFDWETYLELNEDLKKKKLDKSKAEIHYSKHGLKENRKYKYDYELPNDFNWKIYLEVNKDLNDKITTEENAVKHYLKFGIKEKRRYKVFIPNNFDWETYLVINADVKEYGYHTEEKAKYHYLTYGFFENRTFAWCMDILENYIKDDDNLFEKITGNNESFHLSNNNSKIDLLIETNNVKDFSEDNNLSELEYKKIQSINEEICYYTKNKLTDIYTDSFILIIDFPNMGGGAQQFISSILSNYKKNQTFIILRNVKNKLEISINDDYIFDKNMDEMEIIDYIEFHKDKISKIFINHISKHNESLLNKIFELGKETTTITHDYNLICTSPQPFYHEINKCLRPKEINYIRKCDTIIMQNKVNYHIFEPFLNEKNKVVISSLPDCRKSLNKIVTTNTKIVIGVIGFISNKKGSLLIRNIIQKFEKEKDEVEIINFGCLNLSYDKSFKYKDLEEFNELLIQYQPNLLIETSLWPETYSYTLSLGMLTQLPILSVKRNFDGVVKERLSKYDKAHFFNNFIEVKNLIYKVKQDYFYTVEPVFYYNSFWDNYFIDSTSQNSISKIEETKIEETKIEETKTEEVIFKNIENKNVVFITSKIHVSKNKFSYIDNRSIYTSEERLIQTIETIESIRKYIPDSYIILFDNSIFNPLEKSILKKLTDSFINIVDNEELNYYTDICEIKAFADISQQNAFLDLFLSDKNTDSLSSIQHFFKISGRYLVNSDFDFNKYDNDKNIFKRNNTIPKKEYFYTCFYKLDKNMLMKYHDKLKMLLKINLNEWKGNLDCEVLLPNLIKESITEEKGLLGITQRVAVWNDTSKI